jgi:chromosome segregation ATPase
MFLDAIEQLVAEGVVPTVRKIVLRTGGSNTTIQVYWEQWLHDILAANRVGHETLSRGLLDKILAEMDAYATQVVDTVHRRLKAALEQLSECEEEKGRAESEVESLQQQLDSLQQATTTRIRALESELEKAAGRAAALKEGLHDLQKERDGALHQEREAREAAARSRQEAESAVAEARRLSNRIADQDRDVEALRERLSQAEKLGAVAEERARQLEAMVTEQRARIKVLTDFERRAISAEARLKAPSSGGKRGNGGDASRSVQQGPSL